MSAINIIFSDVKRNPENQISVVETKSGSISVDLWQTKFSLIFYHFCQGNYIKITKCQIKLIYTFNVECLKNFSSNGQIWPPKKYNIKKFNWACNLNFIRRPEKPKTDLKPVFNN